MSDAWRYAECSMIKVKVTSSWNSENLPFAKAISSPNYDGAGKWPRILKLGDNT